MSIKISMTFKCSSCFWSGREYTQVEEILKQIKFILSRIGLTSTVVNINLALALHTWIIHIHVVCLILHHGIKVMIVGNSQWHVVRISFTEVCLCVVSHIVAVVVPIKLINSWYIVNTVGMVLCIADLLEYLPSTTGYFVCTRDNVWFTDTDIVTRKNHSWRLDILNCRHTALELQVEIHHVAFADRSNVHCGCVTLLIIVFINYSYDLLL